MSKYSDAFKSLQAEHKDDFVLYGDHILIRILPKEEAKSAGGIYLTAKSDQRLNSIDTNTAVMGEVLLVGAGFGLGSDHKPVCAAQGEVVVVGQNSAVSFSRFSRIPMTEDFNLALIREGDIIMHFMGEDSYKRVIDRMEAAVNAGRSK